MTKVIERITSVEGIEYVSFKCPACKEHHVIPITGPRKWGFNGSFESPTLTPSILCRLFAYNEETETYDKVETICHSFVTDGRIQFLGDCSHPLRGRTLPLSVVEEKEEEKK